MKISVILHELIFVVLIKVFFWLFYMDNINEYSGGFNLIDSFSKKKTETQGNESSLLGIINPNWFHVQQTSLKKRLLMDRNLFQTCDVFKRNHRCYLSIIQKNY